MSKNDPYSTSTKRRNWKIVAVPVPLTAWVTVLWLIISLLAFASATGCSTDAGDEQEVIVEPSTVEVQAVVEATSTIEIVAIEAVEQISPTPTSTIAVEANPTPTATPTLEPTPTPTATPDSGSECRCVGRGLGSDLLGAEPG